VEVEVEVEEEEGGDGTTRADAACPSIIMDTSLSCDLSFII